MLLLGLLLAIILLLLFLLCLTFILICLVRSRRYLGFALILFGAYFAIVGNLTYWRSWSLPLPRGCVDGPCLGDALGGIYGFATFDGLGFALLALFSVLLAMLLLLLPRLH